jgi:hypothetical protein
VHIEEHRSITPTPACTRAFFRFGVRLRNERHYVRAAAAAIR